MGGGWGGVMVGGLLGNIRKHDIDCYIIVSFPQYLLYFGVGNSIRQLFNSAEFCMRRAKDRDTNPWWSSPEARRLNEALGGRLFLDTTISPYALGFDFAQMFASKQHSSGLIMLRCEDLDPVTRSKRTYQLPLMVICGPKQPHDIDAYLSLVLEEFKEYGPTGKC